LYLGEKVSPRPMILGTTWATEKSTTLKSIGRTGGSGKVPLSTENCNVWDQGPATKKKEARRENFAGPGSRNPVDKYKANSPETSGKLEAALSERGGPMAGKDGLANIGQATCSPDLFSSTEQETEEEAECPDLGKRLDDDEG